MFTFEKRLRRTMNAVEMKPVDKIPFSYNGPAYLARRQGMLLKDYVSDFPAATQAAVDFVTAHPGIDSIHTPITCPHSLSTLWLSDVRVPGEDLPDDELWQLEEKETMRFEDYQRIADMGYGPWLEEILGTRLKDPRAQIAKFSACQATAFQRLAQAGVPVLNDGPGASAPFENLCGGRGLENFFVDMLTEPELVSAALEKTMEYRLANYVRLLEGSNARGAWVGGWRAAPEMMSHDMWMEFVWPHLKKMIMVTIEHGVMPILHFDSCWERELETLKELPERKCILMLDGSTDMRLARQVLDDRMCLMGDVPASMQAFGTPEQVYEYVTKLIDDVGPKTGLIVSSGCDAALNARHENIDAMIQATLDYTV